VRLGFEIGLSVFDCRDRLTNNKVRAKVKVVLLMVHGVLFEFIVLSVHLTEMYQQAAFFISLLMFDLQAAVSSFLAFIDVF